MVKADCPWTLLVVLALVSGLSRSTVLADALITKAGKRLEGTVVDHGEFWLLIRPNGSEMRFPKSVIEEAIAQRGLRAKHEPEYMARQGKATTPEAKWELAELCDKWGIAAWRDEQQFAAVRAAVARKDLKKLEGFLGKLAATRGSPMVMQYCAAAICEMQLKSIGGMTSPRTKVRVLTQLARWCEQHALRVQTRAVGLAAVQTAAALEDIGLLDKLLQDLGVTESSLEARQACAWAIYALRSRAAGNDALAHAKLVKWYKERGLEPEARAAEAAALILASQDVRVRKELGYVKDPKSGRWLKGWRVEVASAMLRKEYREYCEGDEGAIAIRYHPEESDVRHAAIHFKFEALTPEPGSPEQRLIAAGMTGSVFFDRRVLALLKNKQTRLFIATRVRLMLKDGSRLLPTFTSWLSLDARSETRRASKGLTGSTNDAPLCHIRRKNLTLAFVPLRHVLHMTLFYRVPKDTRTAEILFHDLPPIPVVLAPPAAPRHPGWREGGPSR